MGNQTQPVCWGSSSFWAQTRPSPSANSRPAFQLPHVCLHVVLGLGQAEGAHLGLTSSCVSKSLHLPLGQGLTSTAGLRPDSGLMGLDHEPRGAGVQGHLSVLLGTPERPQDT